MSHSSHGVVSVGFTTAYDTIASHRHLDTSARAGTTSNAQAARFVQVMNGPTGYSNDFKLHATNCNVVPYSPRAKADPVRWGGRFGIGQARFNQAFENPQASRVAPSAPTGYSRSPHAIFDGANTSSAPSAAPAATWGTMSTVVPSGYSLAHKDAALADSWRAGDLGSGRFEMAPAPTPRSIEMRAAAGSMSAYARSLSSGTRAFVNAPLANMHPTVARLRSLADPFEHDDPHAHKLR